MAFEEERFAGGFGEGVGKAVAEVEGGGMSSFAEVGIGLACNMGLFFGDGFDGDAGAAHQGVELAAAGVFGLSFNDDRGFNEVGRGDARDLGCDNGAGVGFGVAFIEEDREQG